MADNKRLRQILAKYPAAITDFFGTGSLCLFKTGDAWPVAEVGAQKLVRAARPVYHDDQRATTWPQTARAIVSKLDSLNISMKLTAVDPLAYANAGQPAVFCDYVVVISVKQKTLEQDDAVAAAPAITAILQDAGYTGAHVAFVEADYYRQAKFMGFDPSSELESTSKLRKPFTLTPGLAIAPHETTNFEGTGGIYLRLSSDETDKRVFCLTCAHVARPLAKFDNETYTRKHNSQRRENFILLGNKSYQDSLGDIMKTIGDETKDIAVWQSSLDNMGEQPADEAPGRTNRRNELAGFIAAAKKNMSAANDLHDSATKMYSFTESRVFGYVYHSEKIKVGADGYIYDWALIQLDNEMLEPGNFLGNKLYVGGNKNARDWQKYMFAQPHDTRDFHVPDDLLLQVKGWVPEEDFRNPNNYDFHDSKSLLAVKNGRTTGTTYGRVNGLESITRHYTEHGLVLDAFEIIVLGYDTDTGKNDRFSDKGDSGSMAVDRLGRAIGPITGGGGPTNTTDKTYITPYYRLKKEIETTFKGAHLLPIDFNFLFA